MKSTMRIHGGQVLLIKIPFPTGFGKGILNKIKARRQGRRPAARLWLFPFLTEAYDGIGSASRIDGKLDEALLLRILQEVGEARVSVV